MGDLLENLPSLGNFAHAPEGRALAAGCVSGRAARRRAATRPRETRARLPRERVWGEAREGGRTSCQQRKPFPAPGHRPDLELTCAAPAPLAAAAI